MINQIRLHAKQLSTIGLILLGAVFVLVYRGIGWTYVRGYGGDWLIVQLIYVITRFWIGYRWRYQLALGIWLFALLVEIVQLVGSIPRNLATELTIGSTFDPWDMLAYALGLVTVLLTERYWNEKAQH
jgi:hypothetical protein